MGDLLSWVENKLDPSAPWIEYAAVLPRTGVKGDVDVVVVLRAGTDVDYPRLKAVAGRFEGHRPVAAAMAHIPYLRRWRRPIHLLLYPSVDYLLASEPWGRVMAFYAGDVDVLVDSRTPVGGHRLPANAHHIQVLAEAVVLLHANRPSRRMLADVFKRIRSTTKNACLDTIYESHGFAQAPSSSWRFLADFLGSLPLSASAMRLMHVLEHPPSRSPSRNRLDALLGAAFSLLQELDQLPSRRSSGEERRLENSHPTG